MIPPAIDTVTHRIGNLIRVHESGQIDDRVYTRELRAIQDEYLTQPLNRKPVNPEPYHGT